MEGNVPIDSDGLDRSKDERAGEARHTPAPAANETVPTTNSTTNSLQSNQTQEISQRGQDELAVLAPFKIYNPPSPQPASSLSSIGAMLPDDSEYFKPTPADLKLAQDSLAQRTKALQDAPLLTSKLRNEKEEERKSKFPVATIRIKFANRTILEKTFPSSEKIISVYRFVRACLTEDAKAHKFILFSSPPRRDLRVSDPDVKDKSLLELRLAPQSNLFFRFLDDSVTLDAPGSSPPLLPSLLRQCINLPEPSTSLTQSDDLDLNPTNIKLPTKKMDTEKKIPKWLKLAKKT